MAKSCPLAATLAELVPQDGTPSTHETELRLGRVVQSAFRPGLSYAQFGELLDGLATRYPSRRTDSYTTDYAAKGVRLTVPPGTAVAKRKLRTHDFTGYGIDVRASLCEEAPTHLAPADADRLVRGGGAESIRTKDRASFQVSPRARVDLTVVTHERRAHAHAHAQDTERPEVTFEAEIECTNADEGMRALHECMDLLGTAPDRRTMRPV